MGGPGIPPRFGESVSPPSDRDDRYASASEDRDDVLGPTIEATNNPLASFRFGWRGERGATIFASGVVGVFPDGNES